MFGDVSLNRAWESFTCLLALWTQKRWRKFIRSKSIRKWFGTDPSAWILQEYNDPKHMHGMEGREWHHNVGVACIVTRYEPDWKHVTAMNLKVRQKRVGSIKQLQYHIRTVWKSLSTTLAETLVDSMPKWCHSSSFLFLFCYKYVSACST